MCKATRSFNIQHLTFIMPLLLFAARANAQSTIDAVLSAIARNNKTIQASEQYWEAKHLEYKTGLAPYNPTVEYDYLVGSPESAGNQTEIEVSQAFDFPSVYFKKKQLANEQMAQTDFHLLAQRQEILLEAKKACLELIYRNKLQVQLEERKQNSERLLKDFQTKLDKGEGNKLDVNKTRLQLLEVTKQYDENVSALDQLNTKLTQLNGGNPILFTDTTYPVTTSMLSFEELEAEIESSDPVRNVLEQEQNVAQKQVELSKSLWLPKLEAGYRYVDVPGQKFNGVHTGITVPLWANANTVKQQKARLLFSDLELQDHRNEHYHEIKKLYERYENVKKSLEDYQTAFASLESETLLNKALSLGHLSTIEYFMEINYYNTAYNNYLHTEYEFYTVIAELFKYRLN